MPDWLADLERSRRIIAVRVAGAAVWTGIEDAGLLRDALGVALPVGIPEAFLEVREHAVAALLARYAATRGPFTASEAARRFGLAPDVARVVLGQLVADGRLVEGPLRPVELRTSTDDRDRGDDLCDAQVLRRLKRRSLAGLRAELEPVPPRDLARFLPGWQSVPGRLRGFEGLLQAVEQLAGARVPASALESLVLPARVTDYTPQLLDEALSSGEVCWQAHGTIPGGDLWVSLHPAATAELTLAPVDPEVAGMPAHAGATAPVEAEARVPGDAGATAPGDAGARAPEDTAPIAPGARVVGAQAAVLELLRDGAGYFADALERRLREVVPGDAASIETVLWDLAAGGYVTTDSFAAVRARIGSAGAHRRRQPPARARRFGSRMGTGLGSLGSLGSGLQGGASTLSHALATAGSAGAATGRAAAPRGTTGRTGATAGRWSLLPRATDDVTTRAVAAAELLLLRHGVVTRGAASAEGVDGGFTAAYRVLSRAEEAGRVRRGYLVEGLGAAQFAPPAAIDQLRAQGSRSAADGEPDTLVLAATDPANPYGAALRGRRPAPRRTPVRRPAPATTPPEARPMARRGPAAHSHPAERRAVIAPVARPGRSSSSGTGRCCSTWNAGAARC